MPNSALLVHFIAQKNDETYVVILIYPHITSYIVFSFIFGIRRKDIDFY